MHYYMILGLATSLSTTLLLKWPQDANRGFDWGWFERGPPAYLGCDNYRSRAFVPGAQ